MEVGVFALYSSQVIGGDIKRVGHTSSAADPDGVIDLVKVLDCGV